MAWENEANWPEAWSSIYFSPIVLSGSQYIVYATGYAGTPILKLYKYSLTTQTWTYLNTTPVQLFRAMSISPDGSKLAACGVNGNKLYIYNIAGNSWTTSSIAPNFTSYGSTCEIKSTVWADDDTIWCHLNAGAGSSANKCYKYIVSTDTWTQYTNIYSNSTYNSSMGMSVNSAGTALFIGGVYPPVAGVRSVGFKYVIATDTYSKFELTGHGAGGYDFLVNSDRSARVWYIDAFAVPREIYYYDCDAETEGHEEFVGDPDMDEDSQHVPCGIYGVSLIIAHNKTTEPKNRSYFSITAPSVTIDPATSVGEETAVGNGKITDDGGEDCDKRGICWNTTGNPTIDDNKSEETDSFGTGAFSRPITGLSPGTKYYVKAYAHNSAGYGYSSEESFTTALIISRAYALAREEL